MSVFAGEVVSNENAVVENASFLSRSLAYIFRMALLIYRNLHGFARFSGDSLVLIKVVDIS